MVTSSEFSQIAIKKVGVFDSGLGGLTVLKELLAQRPNHDYVYFGDTAHVPYGSREAHDVIALVTKIAKHLVNEGCEALILACNTSSALALSALRATVDVPVLGVIETAAEETARVTEGNVVVFATALTAQSGVYQQKIRTHCQLQGRGFDPEVHEIGCPELVPIVENHLLHTAEADRVLASYAEVVGDLKADTLVLGCTHYPLLLPVLGSKLPSRVKIVNPANLIPEYLAPIPRELMGSLQVHVSGSPSDFDPPASTILGQRVFSTRVVLGSESRAYL